MPTTTRPLAAGLLRAGLLRAGLLAAVLAACAAPGAAPEGPVTPAPGLTPDPGATPAPGATPEPQPVEPTPGMDGVRAVPWQDYTVSADGALVRVRWWSGVAPCTVLDRVEVGEEPGAVTITLFEGSDPAGGDAPCPMVAVYKSVEVRLEAPLGDREVVDGAA